MTGSVGCVGGFVGRVDFFVFVVIGVVVVVVVVVVVGSFVVLGPGPLQYFKLI